MSPTTCAIREAFRQSKLTQAQVAARAEVGARTVWLVLQGRDVRASSRDAVCRALGLTSIPIPPKQFASSREACC